MDAFVKYVQATKLIELARMEQIFQQHGYREEADEEEEHILVLRLDEIGDTILTSAFLRELRRNYPKAWITFVVRDSIYPIAELCPYVNEVLPFPSWKNDVPLVARIQGFVEFCRKHLWKHHYTKCFCPRWDVDIQFSLMLAYLSGARRRIGYSEMVYPQKAVRDRGWNAALTDAVVNPPYIVHEAERNLFILKATGHVVKDDSMEVWLGDGDRKRAEYILAGKPEGHRLIAVTIGSREQHKSYPPELLTKALNMLVLKQFCFALIGGPEEADIGEGIRAALPDGVALNLAGKTSIRESCAVISMASFLIGNDTGLTHAAAALHMPIVELNCHAQNAPVFTWSFYARFFPWQSRCIVLRPDQASEGCEKLEDVVSQVKGCRSRNAHCISGIPPERIVQAVERLLA